MSKSKKRIPKGFRMFRLTDGEIIVVHTRTRNCAYVHWDKNTLNPLNLLADTGWDLNLLLRNEDESISHEIVN